MGQGRGPRICAWTASSSHGRPLARARPLQGAHAGAAGGRPRRHAGIEGRCASCWPRRSTSARACCICSRRSTAWKRDDGNTGAGVGSSSLPPSAPARSAAPATLSWTHACSAYNSKHGWCGHCVGTGLALTREQRKRLRRQRAERRRPEGPRAVLPAEEAEVEGLADAPCPECHGTRLNATARSARVRQPDHRHRRRLERAPGARVGRHLRLEGRDADIARDVVTEIRAAWSSSRSRPRLPDAGPRRAHALGRRGAAHPFGGAARQQPAGRCYVLDEPTIGLHPATTRSCSRPWDGWATRATPWSSSSTTRHHPPRRPPHRHRPRRRQARRRVVAKARQPSCPSVADSPPAACWLSR